MEIDVTPKATPKRPVGRPRKRQRDNDSVDAEIDAKRQNIDSTSVTSPDPTPATPATPQKHTPATTSDYTTATPQKPTLATQLESTRATPRQSTVHGHYKQFTLKEKLEVVKFAEIHSVRCAAKHFKVPKSSVMNWKKTNFTDEVRDKKGFLPRGGRPLTYPPELDIQICGHVPLTYPPELDIQICGHVPLTYPPELDIQICGHVLKQREQHVAVTVDDICIYATEIITPVCPEVKASRNWATYFMKRHELTLRARTSLAQSLRTDLEEKMRDFTTLVNTRREENEFEDRYIVNMDETPMYSDMVPGKTVNAKCQKSVLIRTTGAKKRHLTVVLAISADGDVLPIYY